MLCGGVGYRLAVSAQTLRHVPPVGEQVTLHAHLIVRDDALALYGFHAEQERDLFLMLLVVQAVGPKVALAVLSGGPAARADRGDRRRRRGALPGRPGVGKRTAERIIVELREKVVVRSDGESADESILASRAGEPATMPMRRARWRATVCSSSATRPARPTAARWTPRATAPRS